MRASVVLLIALIGLAALFSGCGSLEQESDWRWKQMNPDYHMSYPANEGSHW